MGKVCWCNPTYLDDDFKNIHIISHHCEHCEHKHVESAEEKEERLKWNNCKQCGAQYGLHDADDHYFVGLPYEGYGND